jgi:hypothetical protein
MHNENWKEQGPSKFLKGEEYYIKNLTCNPGTQLTLYLTPVRNTTGTHLRQGFTRFLKDRLSKDVKTKRVDEEGKREAENAIRELESKFSSATFKKGSVFLFTKTVRGDFRIEFYDDSADVGRTVGREMALIRSRWLAERFMEGYLQNDKPISPKLRNSVKVGIEKVLQK